MKRSVLTLWGAIFFSILIFSGCGKPPETAAEAIQVSRKSTDPEVQADYLVAQARLFYDDKKYKEAEATTNYIINNLDKTNAAAKQILSQARMQLRERR
jgi:hypothetical protein